MEKSSNVTWNRKILNFPLIASLEWTRVRCGARNDSPNCVDRFHGPLERRDLSCPAKRERFRYPEKHLMKINNSDNIICSPSARGVVDNNFTDYVRRCFVFKWRHGFKFCSWKKYLDSSWTFQVKYICLCDKLKSLQKFKIFNLSYSEMKLSLCNEHDS